MSGACLPVPRSNGKRSNPSSTPLYPPSNQLTLESFTSADEYISYVVNEARGMPMTQVHVPLQQSKPVSSSPSSSTSTYTIAKQYSFTQTMSQTSIPRCPIQNLPPTTQWRSNVRLDFASLQQYFEELRLAGVGQKNTGVSERISLPPMKERSMWIEFLLGDVVDGSGRVSEGAGMSANSSLLLQMDQVMVRVILGYLMSYIPVHATVSKSEEENENDSDSDDGGEYRGRKPAKTFKRNHALWIYSLSSLLQTPLHAETCAEIREAIRRLCYLRANVKVGEGDFELLPMVNTILEVFARCFYQAGESEIYFK